MGALVGALVVASTSDVLASRSDALASPPDVLASPSDVLDHQSHHQSNHPSNHQNNNQNNYHREGSWRNLCTDLAETCPVAVQTEQGPTAAMGIPVVGRLFVRSTRS